MATKSNEFPEGAALLRMLFQNTDGELGTMFDLRNTPVKGLEIERKYEITGRDPVGIRFAHLIEKISATARKLGYKIDANGPTTYSGVDQYYVVRTKGGDSAVFRHRFSANVPAELSVKIQMTQGSNLIRGEFNLPMPDAKMQSVRAFMAVVCKLLYPTAVAKHFCIHQTGIFWKYLKENGEVCEVVTYKAGDIKKANPRLFVEIEPKKFDSPETALLTITKFEAALRLKKMRCNRSIAEIFG